MRSLLLCMLTILCGAVLTGCGGSSSTGTPPATGQTPGPVVYPAKIVLEATEPTTLEDSYQGTKIMNIVSVNMGHAIRYIDIPDGWIEKLGLTKIKDKPGALPGKATYVFEAPRDDTYYVNLRAKWMDSCGNSVWVKIDDGIYYFIKDEDGKIADKNYKWAWHQLQESGRPKGFKLTKGQHTLYMAVREDGPWLHQWVLSTDANKQTGEAAKPAAASEAK